MAKVISLNISEEKGTIKKPVDKIIVDSRGIQGDAHAGQWHRQITLLSKERIEEFSREIGRKVNYGEFAENITTEGIDLTKARILDRFKIGKVELEVTQIGKKCHGDACAIYREVGKCVMPKEGIFCRVLHGGKINTGDTLEYIQKSLRTAVVTISDRASSGEYEDLSGPEIERNVKNFFAEKPWRLLFHKLVISDDPENLREELKLIAQNGFDVIFTTGGTGIGPRDNTPEAVNSLIDKIIPGIMEHIRVKYGSKIPNALLSRSVAGTIGRSLIYTLPGSVKAVKEYTAEILPTLEHSIFMVKNINTH
ncbi:MAG: MOSC domain-containing protein [Victivallales bacterium]|nr:MOSC domain-containing protein [Victivallales bacterium]MCF7889401.1 MOSC domain-containing protein [Victivallales bacterium]